MERAAGVLAVLVPRGLMKADPFSVKEIVMVVSTIGVERTAVSYKVRSATVPGKFYMVTRTGETLWSCTCPASLFGRGKHCKHIRLVKDGEAFGRK